MKILNKLYIILIVAVFLACNPEDTDHLRIPDFTTGGAVDIQFDAGFDNFNVLDFDQALQWTLFGRDGANDGSLIQNAEIFVYYTDAAGTSSDTVTWMNYDGAQLSGQTTVQELVDLIPQLSSLADVGAGDKFDFFITEVVMTNGDTFTLAQTSDGLLTNRSDFAWTAFVACPFVADEVVGTYTVTQNFFGDAFFGTDGTGTTREVVAGPGANQVTVVGGVFPNLGGEDLIIDVDPNTGIASWGGTDELHFDPSLASPSDYGAVNGFVFSCIGFIDVEIVSPCCISNFFTMTKN